MQTNLNPVEHFLLQNKISLENLDITEVSIVSTIFNWIKQTYPSNVNVSMGYIRKYLEYRMKKTYDIVISDVNTAFGELKI
jgi:F420-0:gamma-glutamyl ligase